MKKKFLILSLIFCTLNICAQETTDSVFVQDKEISVEKSIWGVQASLVGVLAYNEVKLSNKIALHSEIFFGNTIDWVSWVMPWRHNYLYVCPMLTVEPRFYAEFKKTRCKIAKHCQQYGQLYFVENIVCAVVYFYEWRRCRKNARSKYFAALCCPQTYRQTLEF
ncbi:MAG: hypothetical protein LBS50_11285 [Prevotellaceae bacterium]|nr:hypothetical protein [Prevotellaceae bacterium]